MEDDGMNWKKVAKAYLFVGAPAWALYILVFLQTRSNILSIAALLSTLIATFFVIGLSERPKWVYGTIVEMGRGGFRKIPDAQARAEIVDFVHDKGQISDTSIMAELGLPIEQVGKIVKELERDGVKG